MFDPRNENCKKPFGAVAEGEKVCFAVYPKRERAAVSVSFCVCIDGRDECVRVPMEWSALCLAREKWVCALDTDGLCGLLWYYFEINGEGYGKNGFSESPEKWQLTVYRAYPLSASWFGEGVTYQIFPDRFCASGRDLPEMNGRALHESWSDEPDTPEKVTNSDFFGGDFAGIEEKLPYLHSLGVEKIYLNPIFLSPSNHRYDTADYTKTDPYLGTAGEFTRLCKEARKLGVRIILDGVFSHTGSDSVYFNAKGTYGETGAAQSQTSKYYSWYSFESWPEKYSAWWGIKTLPQVNELEESYLDFITGKSGIAKRWLDAGASGWRLDVADELPDEFIARLRKAAGTAPLIGEVWEDASNKISYGKRRRYVTDGLLDGVMSYPFREAVLAYALGGDAAEFYEKLETLRENYPEYVFYNCMNFLGTHDTERVLTVLGTKERVKIAAAIMFAFPGTPTVYYGDEAGLTGGKDPMNRRTFPWESADGELTDYFAMLGNLRKNSAALRRGRLRYIEAKGNVLCFERTLGSESMLLAANTGNTERIVCKRKIPPLCAEIWREEK